MTDRAGFFAGLADILTAMCVYYAAGGILIMGARWGVHLFWLLLWAAVCSVLFALLLKKPRGVPLLTAVTAALFLGGMALFLLVSSTPPGFGYILVMAVGAGMASGLSLYTCLNRPQIMRHLTHLDVLLLALLAILLVRQALGIDGGTVALMAAVLFLDAASAVGLRMSDGEPGDGNGRDALRASMISLGASAGLALLIWLLTALFSHSGEITGNVLQGIGSFLAAIGSRIEAAFRWFAELFRREEHYDGIQLEEMPSLASLESTGQGEGFTPDPAAVGAVLIVLAAAVLLLIVLHLRRMTVARTSGEPMASPGGEVRRSGGTVSALLGKLRAALRFRWTAFLNRDTPGGLLVCLERRGRRVRTPRQTGESMRAFITRMDESGGLDELSDALDMEYYGSGARVLDAKHCRELRRYMRNLGKAVQHG